MKKLVSLFCAIFWATTIFAQYTVPQDFFAINLWMNDQYGDGSNTYNCFGMSSNYFEYDANYSFCKKYGKVDQLNTGIIDYCPDKIKNLYPRLIRFGGKSLDYSGKIYSQYIDAIDNIRRLGAEPIIQVPYGMGAFTATDAYNLVYFINVTMNKKVKYIEIGNEPNLYDNYPGTNPQTQAEYIAGYFRSFATQIKLADRKLKIIGPSFSSYYSATAPVYQKLLETPSVNPTASIIGTDANGNYYLDIVDFHYYPFDGAQTRADVIDNPGKTSISSSLYNKLYESTPSTGLLKYIKDANTNLPRPTGNKLQFSISEINIDWKNPPFSGCTSPDFVCNNVQGTGANSFLAGQWMAECYAVILNRANAATVDVAFVAPWSIYQSAGSADLGDLGLLRYSEPCTTVVNKRSTWHHLAMMGQYFRGNFYFGTDNNSSGNDISDLKAFSTVVPGGQYAIMILNQSSTTFSNCTLKTNNILPSTGDLRIALNTAYNYTYVLTTSVSAKSTHLILLDCSGNLLKHIKYEEPAPDTYPDPTLVTGSSDAIALKMSSTATGCTSQTSSGTATVNVTPTGSYTYSWSNGGNTATITGLSAGTYTVTVTKSGNCNVGYTGSVVIAKGSTKVTITTPSSANSCVATQQFTATPTGGTSPYTYSWSNGLGSSQTSNTSNKPSTPNTVIEYTVTVTDSKGCTNTALATHYADHSVSITGPSQVCCQDPITLTATFIPGASYQWYRNSTLITGAIYNTYTTLQTGTYLVEVSKPSGNYDPCSISFSPSKVITLCDCEGPDSLPRIAETSRLIENIPNPLKNTTTIYFYLTANVKHAHILITDIYGKIVEIIPVIQERTNVEFNCAECKNGLYFYQLYTEGIWVDSKKMVVIK